jgi:hypothetical protein
MYVKIVIYDIMGKEILKLTNGQMKTGSYMVNWNASNCSSRLYFYKTITSEYAQTKKMVSIK